MKKLNLFISILTSVFTLAACATFSVNKDISERNLELLNEYKLLHVDLSNVDIWGYKSYIKDFFPEGDRATEIINISQGSLVHTKVPTDFAITGEGFFKIRLENDTAGYTRNGNFKVDSGGNLVTWQGYPFYENINFPELFLPDSISVTRDGKISCKIPESNNLIEKEVGQLLVFRVPAELLVLNKDAIYVIKDRAEYIEDMIILNITDEFFNRTAIHQGFLEMSNAPLMAIIVRMYYILSVVDDNTISNREFKKELIMLSELLLPQRNVDLANYYESRVSYAKFLSPYLRHDY